MFHLKLLLLFIIIIIIIMIIMIIIITKNPNLLLITKLTIKSYLQLISLKKLFSQSTILHYSFWLRKKRHLISIEKIHSIKNISYILGKKKIQLKKGSFHLN